MADKKNKKGLGSHDSPQELEALSEGWGCR